MYISTVIEKTRSGSVIQFNDGTWGMDSVKLGDEDDILEASNNLLKIAKDIDEEKTGKPRVSYGCYKNKVAYQMEKWSICCSAMLPEELI